MTREVVCRSDIVRMAHLLIYSWLTPRRIIGILFVLNDTIHTIHLLEMKAIKHPNYMLMGPVNYEELTNYFSWAVLISLGSWGLYSVIDAFSIFFKDEVTFYNPENGKTITFRKHPPKDFDKELVDFWK